MGKTYKDNPNKDFRNNKKRKIKSKNEQSFDALSREIPVHDLNKTYKSYEKY